jgi:hypothetical protein
MAGKDRTITGENYQLLAFNDITALWFLWKIFQPINSHFYP